MGGSMNPFFRWIALLDPSRKGLTLRSSSSKSPHLLEVNSGFPTPRALIQTFSARVLLVASLISMTAEAANPSEQGVALAFPAVPRDLAGQRIHLGY